MARDFGWLAHRRGRHGEPGGPLGLGRLWKWANKEVYLRSDIISDLNIAVGTSTLGVHNSLGDSLTSEVSKFVEQDKVLSEDGSAGTSSHRVLVVVDGHARARRDSLSVNHG